MTRYTATVDGRIVKLNVLPPPWPEELAKWRRFVKTETIFGLDVETTAITETSMFDPAARMRTIQFGTERGAWVLDPHEPRWRAEIEAFLSGPARFVTHTNYDPLWCRREFGIDLGQRAIDTFILASLLDPGPPPVGKPKDLKSLSDRHIDTGLSDAETALHLAFRALAPVGHRQGNNPIRWGFTHADLSLPEFGRYGGLDAVYVRILLDRLAAMVKPRSLKLARREQVISRLANDIQWRGHRTDPEWTRDILTVEQRAYDAADKRLTDLMGCSPRSPKCGEWLATTGVQFPAMTPTGRPKLDKVNLTLLAARYGDDAEVGWVFTDLLTLSERKNLLANLKIILNNADADGMVHPQIKTLQAVTGRMSVTKPAMQTFKKDDPRLRGCFIARDGHVFVGADYDSQEIRLAAAYSRDPAFMRIITEGLSQHDLTAEMIFGKRFTPADRHKAKTLNFAQQYGAGPKRIAFQLGIPESEARRLWLAWREAYSTLVEWTDEMSERTVVVNPWGRRTPRDRFRPYANGNYMIQSSGRDVLGVAVERLYRAGWGERLWMLVHDEIILEVPEEMADEAVVVLSEEMHQRVRGIELTASAKVIGKRWGS